MCVEKESCDKGYDIGAMGIVLSQQEFLLKNQYTIFEGCHYYLFYSFVVIDFISIINSTNFPVLP